MFFSISLCAGGIDQDAGPKPIVWGAIGADIILGLALLIIGIVATQFGFLPSNIQYAFIGAGAAYSFGLLCAVGVLIKAVIEHINTRPFGIFEDRTGS